MHKSVPLSEIVANPFRHMDRYPIREEKIKSLMASMDRTGFWDNVVARRRGGYHELAYGHHRWLAFTRKFGKGASMNLIVRDISDEDMLRMMADENVQELRPGDPAVIEQETIRAVVLAYAEGKIELPCVFGTKARIDSFRNAPSFLPVSSDVFNSVKHIPKPYNAESVARFLGWMSGDQVSPRVRNALTTLEAVEAEVVAEEDMEDLTSKQAVEIAAGAQQIADSYEKVADATKNEQRAERLREQGKETARTTARKVAEKVRTDEYGVRDIQEKMRKSHKAFPKVKVPPTVHQFCQKFAKQLDSILGRDDKRWEKVKELIKYRTDIDEEYLGYVTTALERLSERCLNMVGSLRNTSNGRGTVKELGYARRS